MERQAYNYQILAILTLLVKKYPDFRFGQLLANCDVITYEYDVLCDGQRENILTIDPFNEESKVTLERMLKSKICNEKI